MESEWEWIGLEKNSRGERFGIGDWAAIQSSGSRIYSSCLWQTPAARPPALTVQRIQYDRAAMILISSWVFGQLTVTWMLKLWAKNFFKSKRENKTCEVSVIFLEISWAVELTVPSVMIGDTLAENSGLMYSVTTVAMETLCFCCFTHCVSWRLFVRWIKTKK